MFSKLSDGVVHYITPPPIIKHDLGGKGVKYRSASKKKINPCSIILSKKKDNTNFQTTKEVRSICFERFVTIRQGRHGDSIFGYWRF